MLFNVIEINLLMKINKRTSNMGYQKGLKYLFITNYNLLCPMRVGFSKYNVQGLILLSSNYHLSDLFSTLLPQDL